jgi:NAD(P)-dependent dehydrogenase (short-subunit alcohol dehydrogenase family)
MSVHWRKALFWQHYPRWKKDSVVVITGTSSSAGIGRQLALLYARRDARLVLAARSEEGLRRVAEECRVAMARAHYNGDMSKAQGRVLAVCTDVTIESDCQNLMDRAVDTFGAIDILVLNAGIGAHNAFESTTDLRYARVVVKMRIN